MRILTALANIAKKIINVVKGIFKDKTPAEAINDVAKTATAVGTTSLMLYGVINSLRVRFMKSSNKNVNTERKTGPEIIFDRKDKRSVFDKMDENKVMAKNLFNKKEVSTISKEDKEALEALAKTRNIFFQSMTPEKQLELLKIEDFDFNEYKEDYKRKNKKSRFKFINQIKNFAKSDPNKPFRETPDYGFFNFILQPLDEFVHWFRNDPIPKKVPQIQVLDCPDIPDIKCDTAFEMVNIARRLNPRFYGNKSLADDDYGVTLADLERSEIYAQEIGKHKSDKKFMKAVEKRMMESKYNVPSIFDLMDDDDIKKDKKKKKKDKKKKSSFYESEKKDKKSKNKIKREGLSKEDYANEKAAEKHAKELYQYHLNKSMNGEYDFTGYWK